jgi:hypothetical protein
MYMHCYAFSICQLPNCNMSTQHVIYLYGETPLVNWDPGPFFYIDNTIYCKHYFLFASIILFHSLQTNISFHTIRLILCFQQN